MLREQKMKARRSPCALFARIALILGIVWISLALRGTDVFAGTTFGTADTVSFNKQYSRTFSESVPKAYYRFTIPSSGTVTMTARSETANTRFYFYSEAGLKLWEDYFNWDWNTGMSSGTHTEELVKGTYYLAIMPTNSGEYGGTCYFSLAFLSANESFTETGADDATSGANPISLGTSYRGQIAVGESCDYYRFTAPASGSVNVKIVSDEYNHGFDILDSDGKSVAHDSWSNEHSWDLTLTPGGVYYFRASKRYNYTGNYTFRISDSAAPTATPTPTATPAPTATPTPTATPAPTTAPAASSKAGTPAAKATTVTKVTKKIKSAKTDKDISYSTYSLLRAKGTAASKTSIKVQWTRVKGASQYVIYGNRCGKLYRKLKTLGSSRTSWTQTGLKKGKYYKYIVIAVDENRNAIASSKTIHVVTKGGSYGNFKSVKVTSGKTVKLKAKKTRKISAKAVKQYSSKKVSVHRKLAYESTNTNIAKVSSSGKITAKKAGTCYIYIYAQNGVYARVKVVVR